MHSGTTIKYTVFCATLIVSKSKLEYIKLHGFFEKKVAQYQFIGWKTSDVKTNYERNFALPSNVLWLNQTS
jgi:hypothetical protein